MIPLYSTTTLRYIPLKHPQKPTTANGMAALRGQKPRRRHNEQIRSRHGVFRQAMDLIEVMLFHGFSFFQSVKGL